MRRLPNIRHLLPPVLVGALAFGAYMGNGRGYPSGDTVPARLLPISMLREHDLDLDEFVREIHPGKHYCIVVVGDRRLSAYPLGPAFTALPIYAAVQLVAPRAIKSGLDAYYSRGYGDEKITFISRLEKAAAACIAAACVVVLWLLFRERLDTALAALLTATFALGTGLLSTAAQALWTHGPSCLALALALLFTLRRGTHDRDLFLGGLFAGWAVFCRPSNAVPLAVFGCWVLGRNRLRTGWFLAGGTLVVVVTTALYWHLYGHVLGGMVALRTLGGFSLEALFGVLFSPSRGLLLFSPFLAVAVWGGVHALRRQPGSYTAASFAAALAYVFFYGFHADWGAGFCFGARLLCDVVPFLALPAAAGILLASRRRWLFAAAVALCVFSVLIHVLGAYRGDRGWNEERFWDQETEALWRVRDSQLAWTLIGPPRTPAE